MEWGRTPGDDVELPPLHDDRWDQLVQAVLTDEEFVLVGRTPQDEQPHRQDDQRATEEPSGRRSSTSS